MRIFLTGVSCVGKTAIGAELASQLSVPFFDVDREVEAYFQKPIARLQTGRSRSRVFAEKRRPPSIHCFRGPNASAALSHCRRVA